jgi:hypothetical protein
MNLIHDDVGDDASINVDDDVKHDVGNDVCHILGMSFVTISMTFKIKGKNELSSYSKSCFDE